MIFPELCKAFHAIITQVFSPHAYVKRSVLNFWNKFKNSVFILTLFWAFFGVCGFFLIPHIVTLLFSSNYSISGVYSSYLWLFYCLVSCSTWFGLYLVGQRKTWFMYTQQAGYPILSIILAYLFIDYGVAGLIFAKCLASLSLFILNSISFFTIFGL